MVALWHLSTVLVYPLFYGLSSRRLGERSMHLLLFWLQGTTKHEVLLDLSDRVVESCFKIAVLAFCVLTVVVFRFWRVCRFCFRLWLRLWLRLGFRLWF